MTKLPPNFRSMDLRGRKFGHLEVVSLSSRKGADKKPRWNCVCSCGTRLVVRHDYLLHTNNPKTHCGCQRKGPATLYKVEYSTWYSMIKRCHDPKDSRYKSYGAKGIKVCERWRESFECFLADIGRRPKGCSIDRIDSCGNYEPSNVRWATNTQQARNKVKSLFLPHPETGTLVPAAEVAEFLGVSYQKMRKAYIDKGLWPTQETQSCLFRSPEKEK